MFHWLQSVTGITNPIWYNWWSGVFADLTIFGGLAVVYKRFKCQCCWRLAHHKVTGTHYKTCHKHLSVRDHARMKAKHKEKYPEQHKLLKETK